MSTLPITAMLEERIKHLRKTTYLPWQELSAKIAELNKLIPQVKLLEAELVNSVQKKAKEEERERIVGILDDMQYEGKGWNSDSSHNFIIYNNISNNK